MKDLIEIPAEVVAQRTAGGAARLRAMGQTNIKPPVRVWQSKRFLVQFYMDKHPDLIGRLSVNLIEGAIEQLGRPRWVDGIKWDELQEIKSACGFGACDAVEIYPADAHLVYDANMRHLWILQKPLAFKWRQPTDRTAA